MKFDLASSLISEILAPSAYISVLRFISLFTILSFNYSRSLDTKEIVISLSVMIYAIARTLETTEAELMHTVFPHPTISEAMHESVLDAFDRAIRF